MSWPFDWSGGGAYSSDLPFRWQTPTLGPRDASQTGTGLSLDPCTCVQSSPQDRLLLSCSGDLHLTSQTDTISPISARLKDWPYAIGTIGRRLGNLGHETWLASKVAPCYTCLPNIAPVSQYCKAAIPSCLILPSADCSAVRTRQSARNLLPQTRSSAATCP